MKFVKSICVILISLIVVLISVNFYFSISSDRMENDKIKQVKLDADSFSEKMKSILKVGLKEIEWEELKLRTILSKNGKHKEYILFKEYGTLVVGFDLEQSITNLVIDKRNHTIEFDSKSATVISNIIDYNREESIVFENKKRVDSVTADTNELYSGIKRDVENRILQTGVIQQANDRFRYCVQDYVNSLLGEEWTCSINFIE